MNKKELLKLRTLKATAKMMQMAANDIPIEKKIYYWGVQTVYKYGLYMRCQVLRGILKVAFFLPPYMKMGGALPAYELFINNDSGEFVTYNRSTNKWHTAKLDMLIWPSYVSCSEQKWINPEGYNTIKQYLGVKESGYEGILSYQRKIRQKELELRHKKETDPWDMDLKQTPALPKDWNHWVNKVGIPDTFIFYQYSKRGATTGYCTYCEKEVPIIKPRHNKAGRCQRCRHEIIFKSIGRAGYFTTKDTYMYLIQRCEDGFMIREFKGFRRYCRGKYKEMEYYSSEIRRVIYDQNAQPLRAYYWGLYKYISHRWIKGFPCRSTWYGGQEGRVYGKTMPTLTKNELRKTGLYETVKDRVAIDPEKYLAVLHEVPQLELLAKAQLHALVSECLSDVYSFHNRFSSLGMCKLTKLLGIDSQQLKRLRKNNGGEDFLTWLEYEKTTGRTVSDHVISWFVGQEILPDELQFITDRMSIQQIYNYIRRQMRETGMKSREVLTTWSDYLSMASRFGIDTNDSIIYRVRKLRQRHDELVEIGHNKEITLMAAEVLKKYPHVDDICQSLKGKYEYTGKNYAVIAPNRIEDIIMEGRNLHHCVDSSERYWDRIERRESYVLFLRRVSDMDKSYYTLEIEPDGTVRQKRTMYDRQEADIEDATKFLREWQKIVSERLTDEDRHLAKRSCMLRNEQFKEMREKHVIINTGHLCGQLLADVLLADLMENSVEATEVNLPEAA